jgi:hypothetical protein
MIVSVGVREGVAEKKTKTRDVFANSLTLRSLVTSMIRKKKKKRTLGHVDEEFFKVVKIQISTGELLLDELPDPLEESSESDVRAIRPACEQRNKLAEGGDDERSRITSFGEGAGVDMLVRKDGHLERLHIAGGEVLADEGHEPRERADGGVGSEAALENATSAIALEVQGVVGVVHLIGGEHASESQETVVGVLELR